MNTQVIAARTSFAAFVLAAAIAFSATLGTRLGLFSLTVGVRLLLPAVALGAIALMGGAVWAAIALRQNAGAGARYAVVGLLGAALVVGIPLVYFVRALTSPAIHDISTDVGTAPVFIALVDVRRAAGAQNGPEYDGPKVIRLKNGKVTTEAALQKKYYGDVIPFAQFIKPQKLFWRAFSIAKDMGWQIAAYDPGQGRIEATSTSFWFGITDDIVIRVRPAGKLGARLDIRSKSRFGASDLGANARRLKAFLKALKDMA
jgi:hypothetical protein